MRQFSGEIRKIQYGLDQSKPILTIQIGSRVPAKEGYFICEILEDKDTFLEYGYFEYIVFIAKYSEDKIKREDSMFWKRFLKKPDMIEYSFQDGIENLLV